MYANTEGMVARETFSKSGGGSREERHRGGELVEAWGAEERSWGRIRRRREEGIDDGVLGKMFVRVIPNASRPSLPRGDKK